MIKDFKSEEMQEEYLELSRGYIEALYSVIESMKEHNVIPQKDARQWAKKVAKFKAKWIEKPKEDDA